MFSTDLKFTGSFLVCALAVAMMVFGCAAAPKQTNLVQEPETMIEPPRISPHDAHEEVQARKAILVCAYEDEGRCRAIHLEGAIFLRQFENRLPNLSKDQEIIFYCA